MQIPLQFLKGTASRAFPNIASSCYCCSASLIVVVACQKGVSCIGLVLASVPDHVSSILPTSYSTSAESCSVCNHGQPPICMTTCISQCSTYCVRRRLGGNVAAGVQVPPQVLLLLVKQGGNGLNLTEAQHVVLVEPLLDPGLEVDPPGPAPRCPCAPAMAWLVLIPAA